DSRREDTVAINRCESLQGQASSRRRSRWSRRAVVHRDGGLLAPVPGVPAAAAEAAPQPSRVDAPDRRPLLATRPRQRLYEDGEPGALTGALAEARRATARLLRATPRR